jgi:hypothetical protein
MIQSEAIFPKLFHPRRRNFELAWSRAMNLILQDIQRKKYLRRTLPKRRIMMKSPSVTPTPKALSILHPERHGSIYLPHLQPMIMTTLMIWMLQTSALKKIMGLSRLNSKRVFRNVKTPLSE